MKLTSPTVSREMRDVKEYDGSATTDVVLFEYLQKEKSKDLSSVVVDRIGGEEFQISSSVHSSQDTLKHDEDRYDSPSTWERKNDSPETRNGTRPTDTAISSIENSLGSVTKIQSASLPEDKDATTAVFQARNRTTDHGLEEQLHNDHLHYHSFNDPTHTLQEGLDLRICHHDPVLMEEMQENTHVDVLGCEVEALEFYDLTEFYDLADAEDHTQRGGVSVEKQFDLMEEDPVSLKIARLVGTDISQELASNYSGGAYAATMIRKLFKIKESVPYFVLLPYRLAKSKDGQLGLESEESANVATFFADCVLELTSPDIVRAFLTRQHSCSRESFCKRETEIELKEKEITEHLYSLFEGRCAFLYWLDEATGAPMVKDEAIYPIKIENSVDIIRRILPLMRQSMILLRGNEAYSVLAETLAGDSSISQIVCAAVAKDILGVFRSPTVQFEEYSKNELGRCLDTLLEFVEVFEAQNHQLIGDQEVHSNDWLAERSLLNAIAEVHEPRLEHTGFRPRKLGVDMVLTKQEDGNIYEHSFIDRSDIKQLQRRKNDTNCIEKEESIVTAPPKEDADDDTGSSELDLLVGELSFTADSNEVNLQVMNMEVYTTEERNDFICAKETSNLTSMLHSTSSGYQEVEEVTNTFARRKSSSDTCLSLDQDLDIDEVMRLKILLLEQESKLEFLKGKIRHIEDEERELQKQERRVCEIIQDSVANDMIIHPESSSLTQARQLLLRITELETRVKVSEVEIRQLKNDVTCLNIQTTENNDPVG